MKEIAKDLLEIQAVKLSPNEPFTWASGIKSPIYCDNRLTISYPKIRTAIAKGIAELIRENYPEVEVIAGTATAGIPHAAWIAAELDLPLVYVRSKPKDHGRGKQIEGVSSEDTFEIREIRLDPKKHEVTVHGEVVNLTLKEYELLKRLMKNSNIVLTRDQLLEDIWGYDFDGETRTVDVHVRTLRQKLGDAGEQIETVRGV